MTPVGDIMNERMTTFFDYILVVFPSEELCIFSWYFFNIYYNNKVSMYHQISVHFIVLIFLKFVVCINTMSDCLVYDHSYQIVSCYILDAF